MNEWNNDFEYEYRDANSKKTEAFLSASGAVLGIVTFALSHLPNLFLPALFQLLSVCFFGFAVFIFARFFVRSYAYSVVKGDDGVSVDFLITERIGKRIRIVCRASLSSVVSVLSLTPENRGEAAEQLRGKTSYTYTDHIRPAHTVLVTFCEYGETFCVKMAANDRLLSLLESSKQQ